VKVDKQKPGQLPCLNWLKKCFNPKIWIALMKLLPDDNFLKKLRQDFPARNVFIVAQMGWAGKKNGELL